MLLKRIKSFAFLSITTAACILKRGSGFASPFFAIKEETLKNDPEFDENLDFVLFRDHGKAIARPYYYFKKLMKKCNIDCTKHVWHDLRHTYATLLDQNNMNMKVVSEILGHYSEEFTNEVYVIHKPEVIIYDTSEVMNSFIESLKLDSTERIIPVYDISFIQEYLF